MARKDVGRIGQPSLRPKAAPVSTFFRTSEGDDLKQLAEALAGVAPALGRFARQKQETFIREESEAGGLAGAQAALDGKPLSEIILKTGDDIKAGRIEPAESKWYRMGAAESYGRAKAGQYDAALASAVATNVALQTSTDPDAFIKFEQKFREDWFRENVGAESNEALEKGFIPSALGYVSNQARAFASQAGKRLEGAVNELYYQDVQRIHELATEDATPEDIGRMVGVLKGMNFILDKSSGALLNQTTIKAVTDLAILHKNPEILKILMHVPGGPKGSVLGKTSNAREAVELAKNKIYQGQMRENQYTNNLKATRLQDLSQHYYVELEADISAAFAESGKRGVDRYDIQPMLDKYIAAGATPQMSKTLEAVLGAYRARIDVDDKDISNGLWQDAIKSRLSADAITQAFASQSITERTMKELRHALVSQESGGSSLKDIAQNTTLQRGISRARSAIVGGIGLRGLDTNEIVRRRDEAEVQMTTGFFRWSLTPEGEKALTLQDGGLALNAMVTALKDQALVDFSIDPLGAVAAIGATAERLTAEGIPEVRQAPGADGWLVKRTVDDETLANLETAVTAGGALPENLLLVLFRQDPPVISDNEDEDPDPKAIRRFIQRQKQFNTITP